MSDSYEFATHSLARRFVDWHIWGPVKESNLRPVDFDARGAIWAGRPAPIGAETTPALARGRQPSVCGCWP